MSNNEKQQVDPNIFCRTWQRLRNLWRELFDVLCLNTDSVDSGGVCKRSWQCLFGFLRRVFRSRSSRRRINYPRLELPPYDLHFEYNMNHKHRGVAIVFNHEFFAKRNLTRRFGTDLDVERLEAVLNDFNFDVKVFNNLKLRTLFKELEKVASMDHTKSDCLLVTVLSHGEQGKIHSFDDDYRLEEIAEFFSDENCPSLKGKPRLFFIQACRGSLFDAGHRTTNKNNALYSINRPELRSADEIDPATPFQNIRREIEEDMVHNPPNHQDFLFVRSTMAGYYSFRNTTDGSWFIQDLCAELEENGTSQDILHILTHVNWRVSERLSVGTKIRDKKQIICISSMLTKILKLNVHDLPQNIINN